MEEKKKERCFVIMPISDQPNYPERHFTKIYEQLLKPAIEDAGYEAYRVDENKICDSIIDKIFEGIQSCEMCLCDLSSKNANALYELGLRQAYDKPVVLVQDDVTDPIFDVSAINTTFYRRERLYDEIVEDRVKITEAIKATQEHKIGYASLINVVKTQKAVYDNTPVSSENKTEIMLSKIMKEIDLIKKEATRNASSKVVYKEKTIYQMLSEFNNRIENLDKRVTNMLPGMRGVQGINASGVLMELSILENELASIESLGYINNAIRTKLLHLRDQIIKYQNE